MPAKRRGLELAVGPPMKDKVFRRQNYFRKTVAVEIVENERIDEVGFFRRRDRLDKDGLERRLALACLERQTAGVDSFYGRQLGARRFRCPIHNQLSFQDGAFRKRRVDQVRRKIEMTLPRPAGVVGGELNMAKFGAVALPAGGLRLLGKAPPLRRRPRRAGSG